MNIKKQQDPEEIKDLKQLIQQHVDYTESAIGERVLADWRRKQ